MHEMGIVFNLAGTIEEIAQEEQLNGVEAVVLEVGEVSGIMTDYFCDCWDYFKPRHPLLANSELRLVTVPAVTICGDCGKTYGTVDHGKICPYCGSAETWLLEGNGCVIKEIEGY